MKSNMICIILFAVYVCMIIVHSSWKCMIGPIKIRKNVIRIHIRLYMYVTRGTNFVTHKLCSNDITHFATKIFQHSTASTIGLILLPDSHIIQL